MVRLHSGVRKLTTQEVTGQEIFQEYPQGLFPKRPTVKDNQNGVNMTVSDYLFLKTMEEMGEAVQAIAKLLANPEGTYDDGTKNIDKVASELGDVSTFIACLIDGEQIPAKVFWDGFQAKSKKIAAKLEKLAAEEAKEKPTDDDSK
jgi:NTP pyrophosphatase (non-canonical NTP hydrolase)